MGAPLVLLFLVLLVYPVGQLLLLTVYSEGAFTLAKYRQLFASSVYVNVMLITLKISLWTTLLSVDRRLSGRLPDLLAAEEPQGALAVLGAARRSGPASWCAPSPGS